MPLELTGCCARAHDFGVAGCKCLHFELPLNFHPSPLWMELELALAARRAVASMSIGMEWLTLKAAISMTTLLVGCAYPSDPLLELTLGEGEDEVL